MAREAHEVVLPELGESVTEGIVTRWLKQVGDEVEADEPLLEVSTDKVDTEIPAPASGTLLEITVDEDETAEVGAKLALIGTPDEAPQQSPQQGTQPDSRPGSRPDSQPDPAQGPGSQPGPAEGPGSAQEPYPAPAATAAPTAAPANANPAASPNGSPAASPNGGSNVSPNTGVGPAAREAGPGAEPGAGPAGRGAVSQTGSQGPAGAVDPVGAGSAARPASEGFYATPMVRKLAREHGVDPASVAGTGVGGRVRAQDVTAAAEAARQRSVPVSSAAAPSAPPAPHVSVAEGRPASGASPRGTTVAMDPSRRAAGAAAMRALHDQAQLTTVVEVDVTEVARLRARAADAFAAREGVPLTMLPFLVLAAARVLKAHPAVHARIDEGEGTVTYFDTEDIAFPVDTERGLVSPVLRDAGGLGLAGIARRASQLTADARADRLGQDATTGATFTVGELGDRGVLFETAIVPPDQAAALSLGTPVARPVAVADPQGGDVLAVRRLAHLALSYDHRLVDGADAARFLAAVKQVLESGSFAAELGL
ncbi:2-oxo acid dehydrogenase subunit E2 [Streptomyces sp. PU-14G]|uniref:2-oxo acid dehydrogenase subunit E2 n=1 Tax=Streptomyces sp. PU-14G TaxID=2800808 RepID=UPI0034DFD7CD